MRRNITSTASVTMPTQPYPYVAATWVIEREGLWRAGIVTQYGPHDRRDEVTVDGDPDFERCLRVHESELRRTIRRYEDTRWDDGSTTTRIEMPNPEEEGEEWKG